LGKAHLHGGVPLAEIDALHPYFINYPGVCEHLFRPRDDRYQDFAATVDGKDNIKPLVESAPGVQDKHAAFHTALDTWWTLHVPTIEDLPNSQNVLKLRRDFLGSLAQALAPLGILDVHQIRGSFAAYIGAWAKPLKTPYPGARPGQASTAIPMPDNSR
jgi:type I restriction enzyme M protein